MLAEWLEPLLYGCAGAFGYAAFGAWYERRQIRKFQARPTITQVYYPAAPMHDHPRGHSPTQGETRH